MYKYELHMHTKEASACSPTGISDMIVRYKQLGFSGAVVTNHFYSGNTCIDRGQLWKDFVTDYCRAYYIGQETAHRLDFDLLFGVEEGYGGGKEILVYGIEPEFLLKRPQLRGADLSVWSAEVRAAHGFIAYAHPFRDRPYIRRPDAMPDLSLVDGIEVYNLCNTPEENEKAAAAFSGSGKSLIAGSDLHNDTFEHACGVMLPQRVSSSAQLAQFLASKQFTLAID